MKSIVALEVSKDIIRAAEVIAPLSKKPRVSKTSEFSLEPGIIGESMVHDSEAFVEILKEFWAREKFSTKNIALVVSGRRFVIREHETSHTSLKALRSVLDFESKSVIPEQMINPIVDFYPTRSLDTKTGIKTSGLIIATPADPIESLLGSITRAGLHICFVDFAPMAIARFIQKELNPTGSYVLANIRDDSTDILIAKNNIPQFIRVAPNGLETKPRKVGRRAAKSDAAVSFTKNGYVEESPSITLAREINNTALQQMEYSDINISTLYVSGPRSTDPDLLQVLESQLNLTVTPLSRSNISETSPELDSACFVSVCGGLRGKK